MALQDPLPVQHLVELLDHNDPVTVLDIRDAAARAEWSIPGSVHTDDVSDLPDEPPVVVVCARGRTAGAAVDELQRRGFRAVVLQDGMQGWSSAWNTALISGVPGARVVQVRRVGKGCLSYIVASGGVAAVVDASLPHQVYEQLAGDLDVRITHVVDTHVHADHVSRGRDLARRAGAVYHLPTTGRVDYDADFLAELDAIRIGDNSLTVVSTPGHTDESISLLLDEHVIFVGDTLCVESVGRPDLAADPDIVRERALKLHDSIERLLALDPATVVACCHCPVDQLPRHGQPHVTTIGDVRADNPTAGGRQAFLESVTTNLPPTPPNHEAIIEINTARLRPLDPAQLLALEAGPNRCATS